ncbi:MAG TPA: TonB-dependent receptor plug domain-containing protein, partial [Membranihabitans sp.]|nr:TonB-dependent receptor plug domain-containing protein [Membranihabitans sp.]
MKRSEHTRWKSMLGMVLVCRIVSAYSGISKYFLSDQRSITSHSGAYVRLMMMMDWPKRCRNACRNLGFGVLVLCIQNYSIANSVLGHDHSMDEIEFKYEVKGPLPIDISGTVTDENGEVLIGVNIQVKGSNTGTASDVDGNFILEDVGEDAVLVVSYIGYQTQEVPVEGRTVIHITLFSDMQLLDEVVVVGYGTQKKSDLTGAVSTISGRDFENVPASRVDQILQGKAPGVQVTQVNGAPGSGSTIRIRGGNSIQGNNEPLYVIDGFIVGTDFNLNNININDIESIEVLKDASSISIYGTRGANGV